MSSPISVQNIETKFLEAQNIHRSAFCTTYLRLQSDPRRGHVVHFVPHNFKNVLTNHSSTIPDQNLRDFREYIKIFMRTLLGNLFEPKANACIVKALGTNGHFSINIPRKNPDQRFEQPPTNRRETTQQLVTVPEGTGQQAETDHLTPLTSFDTFNGGIQEARSQYILWEAWQRFALNQEMQYREWQQLALYQATQYHQWIQSRSTEQPMRTLLGNLFEPKANVCIVKALGTNGHFSINIPRKNPDQRFEQSPTNRIETTQQLVTAQEGTDQQAETDHLTPLTSFDTFNGGIQEARSQYILWEAWQRFALNQEMQYREWQQFALYQTTQYHQGIQSQSIPVSAPLNPRMSHNPYET